MTTMCDGGGGTSSGGFLTVRIRVHTFCYVSLLSENPKQENQKAG